jgi:hypothetical protein
VKKGSRTHNDKKADEMDKVDRKRNWERKTRRSKVKETRKKHVIKIKGISSLGKYISDQTKKKEGTSEVNRCS